MTMYVMYVNMERKENFHFLLKQVEELLKNYNLYTRVYLAQWTQHPYITLDTFYCL